MKHPWIAFDSRCKIAHWLGIWVSILFLVASSPLLGQDASQGDDTANRASEPEEDQGTAKRDAELDLLLENAGKANSEPSRREQLDKLLTQTPLSASVPDEVKASYHAYLKARYKHQRWAFRQRQWIYEWQFWAGIIVFIVSIGIVILGLYMSWLQFDAFYRTATAPVKVTPTDQVVEPIAGATPTEPERVPAVIPPPDSSVAPSSLPSDVGDFLKRQMNQLEVTQSGVKLSTPLVGIVILTLSLAFFYLYLKFVFEIN